MKLFSQMHNKGGSISPREEDPAVAVEEETKNIDFMAFANFVWRLLGWTDDEFENYRTTTEFGYEFNKDGQLRNIEDGKRFQFNFYNNKARDQRRYEALGEVITEYVYELLVNECGLEKHYVPVEAIKRNEPFSFIFMSPGALQKERLLLLVQGSGVVRAGQWARRLIINDCLDSGTQIPYIKQAMEEGYGVVVLNPNDNRVDGERLERERTRMEASKKGPQPNSTDADAASGLRMRGRRRHQRYHYIRDNESPEKHIEYVWQHFVEQSRATRVFLVAHSCGGQDFVNVASSCPAVLGRLSAVALTASSHRLPQKNKPMLEWFQKNSVNWVTSSEALDTRIHGHGDAYVELSAGTTKHGMTSWCALQSIFTYFDNKLENPDYQPARDEPDETGEVGRRRWS
ncbi:cotranscriptional regulator FAM172A homolog [Lethenteron reissneri]|uniref:cotranscriptional regulator FAM172A homolog n=1 Tax=Lethenteron reissneri TaxID=7753 RepID=UPI002AB7F305|nr:cotranscriptional regulator FAM172A homolog [Lethenteron reissneri]